MAKSSIARISKNSATKNAKNFLEYSRLEWFILN